MLTVLNCLLDTVAQRILDTDNGEEGHLVEDISENSLGRVILVDLRIPRWPAFKVAIDETNSSERAGCVCGDYMFERLAIISCHRSRGELF